MGIKDDQNWQDEIRQAFRNPSDLAAHLELAMEELPSLPADSRFPLLVPRGFADRMAKGDPHDPLLRQVWPEQSESVTQEGELADPVGDLSARKAPGLLQKYHGRALVVATGACAVHCRYCFRQNFPYDESARSQDEWSAQLESIRQDPSLHEVVLSGGDPLSLSDSVLEKRIADLGAVEHLATLRIHTRLPVVVPSRVTSELCRILSNTWLRKVVVLHANHASEIDASVVSAVTRLREAGATVLNQSVLLAGVNDSVGALERLSHALWNAGVLPYYLHALDRVRGSSRFAVDDEDGIRLIESLRTRLPGYLVPKLVREIEGAESKTRMG
jgi:L-lysine 2,3-aminomutase